MAVAVKIICFLFPRMLNIFMVSKMEEKKKTKESKKSRGDQFF
jgi:hypothetical protein